MSQPSHDTQDAAPCQPVKLTLRAAESMDGWYVIDGASAYFYSPRNSSEDPAPVPLADADALAAEIRTKLDGRAP